MNKGLSEKLKRDIKLEIVEGGGGVQHKIKSQGGGRGSAAKMGKEGEERVAKIGNRKWKNSDIHILYSNKI